MIRILSIRLHKLLHDSFIIGLILKGLNGLAELVGATLILFVTPEAVRSFVRALTFHELTEDPHDVLANALLRMAKSFSISTQVFAVLYLAIHGAVKIFLIVMLLRRKYWAYPVAVVIFTIFIIYQVYRYTVTHSISLVLLSVVDVIVIVLTIIEYNSLRHMPDRFSVKA
jgi:uncharacterized membrane protein